MQARHRSPGRGAAATKAASRRWADRPSLPWNLEWAAKWGLLGVTVEGLRKDLATAGGLAPTAPTRSAARFFEVEPPRNVTYEFLNIGGKKMSTSKGQGAAAPHHRRGPAA